MSRVGTLVVVTLVAVGCGAEGDLGSVRPAIPKGGFGASAQELHGFNSLSDWKTAGSSPACDSNCRRAVATDGVVVVVRVVDEQEIQTPADPFHPGRREILRDLVADVEQVIRGRVATGSRILIRNGYWVEEVGQRMPALYEGSVWLEPGDRALVALTRGTPDLERYHLFTSSSVFVLKDGQVVDTDRRAPIVRELERLSEAEIRSRAKQEAG